MIGTLFNLVAVAIAAVAGVFAFGFARGFVRRRLRFVDSVRSPGVPVLAAVVAGLIVLPLTLLPLITGLTAASVGLGAGLGTRSGVKALQRGDVVVR
ncbi:MAG TPA: hypothetical protein VFU23_03215 [Gemmatimonadales bacterium]|nr:hypothetical protein [Gemmatimonadales bacterium]